jgi:DNA-binding SARP family transcriptional activator
MTAWYIRGMTPTALYLCAFGKGQPTAGKVRRIRMHHIWRVTLFGGLAAVRSDDAVAHFETRKTGALLCCLVLNPDRAHSREVLAEQLWPDEDWEATRSRLRQALSALRRALEPAEALNGSVLIADRNEIRLAKHAIVTDTSQFEIAVNIAASAANRSNTPGRIENLRTAVTLYKDGLLPGYYEASILEERARLEVLFQEALRRLVDLLGGAGEYTAAIEFARRAIASDPLREDSHQSLMRLFAQAGRPADVMRQYRAMEQVLRDELGVAPSRASRRVLEEYRAEQLPAVCSPPDGNGTLASGRAAIDGDMEPDGGAVPLESTFYVVRPTDEAFDAAIARGDSIVLVKGARQAGKTSLLARGLQQARQIGTQVILTDLQKLTAEQLDSGDAFFYSLAESIIDQLDLSVSLDADWNSRRSWNVNFERFLRREVLGAIPGRLTWGIDEVDRLFGRSFSTEVFGLFRSWHNERYLNPAGPWKKLTLVIAYATEAHLFITDLNQSPFNVGTRLMLEEFVLGEVEQLNRKYRSPLRSRAEIESFLGLVGGNPYLVRRGLHAMASQGLTVQEMIERAGREGSVFADHLRRLLTSLLQNVDLCETMRAVLRAEPCLLSESFYRLRSAGILIGDDVKSARLRCDLYRTYFESHLL